MLAPNGGGWPNKRYATEQDNFGMDRETLEMNLTQAEAHIAKGHERIAQQHEIIAELNREGHDTAPAKDMLASFERTQAMHIANRDRIASKLATLD
jgi:hypothetical protein